MKPPKLKAYQKECIRKEKEYYTSKPCIACNGTGHYDHDGSPPCDACNGTGKNQIIDSVEYKNMEDLIRRDNDRFMTGFNTEDVLKYVDENSD